MARPKRVLVAPLNWGLGHATRCIPVIRFLKNSGHEVIIATDGDALLLLKTEFPELKFHELPGYEAYYSRGSSLVFALARQLPKFISAIKKEHNLVSTLVETEQVEAIISDNRYGVWSDKVPTAIISHQLNLLMPGGLRWMGPVVNAFHRRLLRKFNFIWIPDAAGSVLSGYLSASHRLTNTRFIGPLSRFNFLNNNMPGTYDLLAVLSGPEPQRTVLEKILLEKLSASGLMCLLVRGVVKSKTRTTYNNITVIDFLPATQLNMEICRARVVVARPGYSTIMDLAKLGKKAILIPTPGQTEQAYLGERAMTNNYAFVVNQHNFNIAEALERIKSCFGFPVTEVTDTALSVAVEELLP